MRPLTFSLINTAVLAGISSAMPFFTRPDVFFGITVPVSFRRTEAGRRIVTRYIVTGWCGTGLLAAAILLSGAHAAIRASIPGTLIVWLAAFLGARHAVLPHAKPPDPGRTAVLTPRRDRIPGGPVAMVIPFAVLALKGLEFYYRWDSIPGIFPVHWGFNGPDRWTSRTPFHVFGSLFGVAAICGAILWTAWGIIHATRRIAVADDTAGPERRFRRFGAAGLIVLAYALALTLPPIPNMYLTVPFGPFLIIAASIAVVASLAMLGQGGSRISELSPLSIEAPPTGDGTLDRHWKLGLIYFNRSDPALLVEKRFGIGWTLNMGHPVCWIILASLLVWPVVNALTR